MGVSAKFSLKEVGTSSGDRPTASSQTYVTETGSSSGLEGPPEGSPSGTRVRYGETEAGLIGRSSVPTTDIRPYGVGVRDDQIDAWVSKCNDVFERLLETEDIIDRENLYRTLDEYLTHVFDLRSYRERTFGHLLVTLMSVTKHTTSEFFSSDQLLALKRVIPLIKKPKTVESDVREARRILSRAGFDVFRPLRGVFRDDSA